MQVTISAPHIHATCLEALAGALRTPGARVLDVGCGSGILLAYMARMAPASAALVGLEIVGRLAERSAANLRADGFAVGDDPRDGQHARIEVRHLGLLIRAVDGVLRERLCCAAVNAYEIPACPGMAECRHNAQKYT